MMKRAIQTGSWFRPAMVAGLLMVALWPGMAQGQSPGKVSQIRVACLDVYGTAERGVGPKNMARCLAPAPEFTFRTINSAEIRNNGLAQVDVLICHGASGSKQGNALEEAGRRAIQVFVRNGGGYVRFCAGSYLASGHIIRGRSRCATRRWWIPRTGRAAWAMSRSS